jgi:hypothetical protein
MPIHNFDCRYHRNGVRGEGFHLCTFSIGRGRSARCLGAVLFDGDGRCAIFHYGQIDERYRAEDFEPELRRLAAASDESGQSFDHATNEAARQEVSLLAICDALSHLPD